jgi:hypothetical protein
VDENNVAQFFYHHLPEGSPELKYGGIAPTGALPDKVNFPLAKSQLTQSPEQHCVIGADVQTYNQKRGSSRATVSSPTWLPAPTTPAVAHCSLATLWATTCPSIRRPAN